VVGGVAIGSFVSISFKLISGMKVWWVGEGGALRLRGEKVYHSISVNMFAMYAYKWLDKP
jgi:hypothetical protein